MKELLPRGRVSSQILKTRKLYNKVTPSNVPVFKIISFIVYLIHRWCSNYKQYRYSLVAIFSHAFWCCNWARWTHISWYVIRISLISAYISKNDFFFKLGAVVAREYGLPCLVGVQNATRCFKTGDKVRLSSKSGVLELIE